MSLSDLAASVSNSLTQLDTLLASGTPAVGLPDWQQLFALRKHLDDQQRTLVQQTVQADDEDFENAAATVKTATTSLSQAIAGKATTDNIINIVAQISSAVDSVLKLV